MVVARGLGLAVGSSCCCSVAHSSTGKINYCFLINYLFIINKLKGKSNRKVKVVVHMLIYLTR